MYPDYHFDFGSMPNPDFISRFHDAEGSGTAGEGEDAFEEVFSEADVNMVDGDDRDDDDNNDDTSNDDSSEDMEGNDSSNGSN